MSLWIASSYKNFLCSLSLNRRFRLQTTPVSACVCIMCMHVCSSAYEASCPSPYTHIYVSADIRVHTCLYVMSLESTSFHQPLPPVSIVSSQPSSPTGHCCPGRFSVSDRVFPDLHSRHHLRHQHLRCQRDTGRTGTGCPDTHLTDHRAGASRLGSWCPSWAGRGGGGTE